MKLLRITTIPLSLKILLKGQLPFMKTKGFETLMVSANGPDIDILKSEQDSPHISIPLSRKITPLRDLYCIIHFMLICLRLKPAIVHSHTPKAGLVGMIGAKLGGVRVRMHTVAGLPLMEAKGLKRKILLAIERVIYSSATHVYSNSIELMNFILSNKLCPIDKIKVIGNGSSNGIDSVYFSESIGLQEEATKIKKNLELHKDHFVFIFIGRLVKDKGIVELVKAFCQLQSERENVSLILVGDFEKDLDPLPEETLLNIRANKMIKHVGFIEDIRPYLLMSNVLVFPSYREGLPNVPMQAGCMNIPSIASNINGCNEIIVDRYNGVLVEPKNIFQLYSAMNEVLNNEDLYRTLKMNARKMIVDRYDQRMIWELLYAEYSKALKN